jgi:Uncharacterised nucleotidyltransferase
MSSASGSLSRIDAGLDWQTAASPGFPSMEQAGVPFRTAAVIQALRFRERSTNGLASLSENEWPELVDWCSRKQLVVMLGEFCEGVLPDFVQRRIAGIRLGFERRTDRLVDQLAATAGVLSARGIESVVLKGFSHCPELTPNMLWRAQGDIDLWCWNNDVQEAYQALRGYGYVPRSSVSSRHLAPLTLPSNWVWNGNYTEIPIGIELHHKLWSETSEHFAIPGLDEMWLRRRQRPFFGGTYNVLAPTDILGFAALHLLLHLLHGDLPLQRAWEIASFLHRRSTDERFWDQWQRLHPSKLRRIEALIFRLVQLWFWCDMPERLGDELGQLPQSAQLWLQQFPFAPLCSEYDRNKNLLWLHLALADSLKDRVAIARQHLIPVDVRAALTRSPACQHSRWRRVAMHLSFLGNRVWFHACGVLPTLWGGIVLSWRRQGIPLKMSSFSNVRRGALFGKLLRFFDS